MSDNNGKGFFVVVDGIDGCGKGSIVTALKEYLMISMSGASAIDLRSYWNEYKTYPTWEEIAPHKIILSCEMTNVWIGRALRDELIRNGTNYSPRDIAEAYALDRLILYTRVILPAREQGKIILQERSVSTSLVYQNLQQNGLTREEIMNISGNEFALAHPPDVLMIPLVDPATALERNKGRYEKNDNAIFEKLDFLKKADAEFRGPWLKEFFESKGTRVVYLDGSKNKEAVAREAIDKINQCFPSL